jgi:hypothetical protein
MTTRLFHPGGILLLMLLIPAASATSAETKALPPADDLAAPLRKLVADGVAAGTKPNVYLDVFGKNTRVQVVGADAKGVTVVAMGNNLPLDWKTISAPQMGALATEFAKSGADHLSIVRFFAAKGMAEKAEKSSMAALQLDKDLGPEIKTALALLPKEEPKPAAVKNDEKKTGSTATKTSSTPAKNVASPIPEARRIDWKPGIPGGVPKYPQFASVKDSNFGAKGDGIADDTAAIQKAIDDCPAGKAVFLPAGTYRLTATLNIIKGVALRGEGPDKTKLINEANQKQVIFMGSDDYEATSRIVGGCVKGSSCITVENAAAFKAGDLVLVDQLNDPDIVDIEGAGGKCGWAGREAGKRAMGQLVRVVGKDGSNLVLSRPLYFTFKPELLPEASRTTPRAVTGAGVEDLYIETTRGRTDSASTIKLWNCIHSWVKNVECCMGWYAGHVSLQRCLGCEVRDSYFHHAHRYGAGHGYGVWIFAQSTDTLVENNIAYHLNSGYQIECGGPGNVIAYNFSDRIWGRDYPKTDFCHFDIGTHGAHPYMNLFESNYVSTIGFDFYWGSSSHTTIFRNYADMDVAKMDGQQMWGIIACKLDQRNYYFNVIGNVFGEEGTKGALDGAAQKVVYRFGVKNPGGNSGPGDDQKVTQTAIRHANFDFITKQIHWDPSISNRQLPSSMYLTAKPAFFGNLQWPAIGPDVSPMHGMIPAYERFLKIPKADRDAQDQLYLGAFHVCAGNNADARTALTQVLAQFANSPYAAKARKLLEQVK